MIYQIAVLYLWCSKCGAFAGFYVAGKEGGILQTLDFPETFGNDVGFLVQVDRSGAIMVGGETRKKIPSVLNGVPGEQLLCVCFCHQRLLL